VCECLDHRAHVPDTIHRGNVAKRQAGHNRIDASDRFIRKNAAQVNGLTAANPHAGKFAAEESRERRIALNDEQTFRLNVPVE
jgi:hypothetical protein